MILCQLYSGFISVQYRLLRFKTKNVVKIDITTLNVILK
jgi:hypothetical protein